jgi:hypothetical protein
MTCITWRVQYTARIIIKKLRLAIEKDDFVFNRRRYQIPGSQIHRDAQTYWGWLRQNNSRDDRMSVDLYQENWVTELIGDVISDIRRLLADAFANILVRGELSIFRRWTSPLRCGLRIDWWRHHCLGLLLAKAFANFGGKCEILSFRRQILFYR